MDRAVAEGVSSPFQRAALKAAVYRPASGTSLLAHPSISGALKVWKNLTRDPEILNVVRGLHIFSGKIIQPKVWSSGGNADMLQTLTNLYHRQIIRKTVTTDGQLLSHAFLREKSEGFRLILNLKHLNTHLTPMKFKMENFAMATEILREGSFMAKVDLKDAFYSISVREDQRKLLRFVVNNETWEFQRMVNGLSTAPRTFTKLMKPVVSYLRELGIQLVIFLDDIWICSPEKKHHSKPSGCSGKVINISRIQNKQEKVNFDSNPKHRIPRIQDKLSTNDSRTATGKKRRHKKHSKQSSIIKESNIEKTSRMAREDTSFRNSNTGSKASHAKNPTISDQKIGSKKNHVKKRTKEKVQQKNTDQPCSEARIDLVEQKHTGHRTSKNKRTERLDNDGQRRVFSWMGGSVPRGSNSGHMVNATETAANQPFGADSGNKNLELLHTEQARDISRDEDRQQNSNILHQQEGGNKISETVDLSTQILGFSDKEGSDDPGNLSPEPRERHSGLVIQNYSGTQRMDAAQKHIQKNNNSMGETSNRPVCIRAKQTNKKVHFVEMGGESCGNRCLSPGLGKMGPSVQLPRTNTNREDPKKTGITPTDTNDPGLLSMGNTTMVSCANQAPGRLPQEATPLEQPDSRPTRQQPSASREGIVKPGGLEGFRQRLHAEGFSEDVTALVEGKWKPTSRNTYESSWKGWDSWCTRRGTNPHEAPITEVANYLTEKTRGNISYDALNVIRSAISAFAKPIEGTQVGQHKVIIGLMKGYYNKNPPRPRYSATWCIDTVLDHWRVRPDNGELDLKELTIKTVMLLAISQLKRAHEINNMLLENYAIRENGLEFLLKETPKQQRRGRLDPIIVNRLRCDKIDPVSCLMEYIDRTKESRAREDGIDRTQLFLSISNLHRPVTTGTVSNWIKQGMEMAGIDTSTYRPHSIRSATVSTVRHKGISLKAILRRGQWKHKSVLKKYYLRNMDTQ